MLSKSESDKIASIMALCEKLLTEAMPHENAAPKKKSKRQAMKEDIDSYFIKQRAKLLKKSIQQSK